MEQTTEHVIEGIVKKWSRTFFFHGLQISPPVMKRGHPCWEKSEYWTHLSASLQISIVSECLNDRLDPEISLQQSCLNIYSRGTYSRWSRQIYLYISFHSLLYPEGKRNVFCQPKGLKGHNKPLVDLQSFWLIMCVSTGGMNTVFPKRFTLVWCFFFFFFYDGGQCCLTHCSKISKLKKKVFSWV